MNSNYPNYSEFKENRKIVLKNSDGLCEQCGDKAKDVHHIDGEKFNHEMENLKALCHKCHMAAHKELRIKQINKDGILDAEKIIKLIRLKGYTKTMLSRHKGIHLTTIIKSGRANPRTINKLIDYLGCDFDDILTDEYLKEYNEIKNKDVSIRMVDSSKIKYKKFLVEINKEILENITTPQKYLEKDIADAIKNFLLEYPY